MAPGEDDGRDRFDDYRQTRTTTLPDVDRVAQRPSPTSPQAPPPARRRWWLIFLVILLVLVGLWILVFRKDASQAGPNTGARGGVNAPGGMAAFANRPVAVQTAEATKGDIGVYINALGTVTPVYTVSVTSRVQGEIVKVYYREGQMVHKGDPLLEIDPRPYQVQLSQAEGQYQHDTALLNEARIDLQRYQAAYSRNAIAQQQVADQEQTVKQDEGTVKNDQAQIDNAKLQLTYARITAPISGRVGLRLVDPGNIVQANNANALVVITQIQPITVLFSVAEDYLPQIQQQLQRGQRMRVDALGRDQQTQLATGYLLTIDNVIDPTTGTIKLKALFPNKDSALFPNQFVNARLLVNTLRGVTLVPSSTIQRNAQTAFVYVVDNGTAKIRPVKAGVSDANNTQVDSVQPGETVVTSGFDKLQDGSKVMVRTVRPKAGGNASSPGANARGDGSS